MIRRSRISVRPNVRPGVAPRTGPLATPQDGPLQSQAAVEAPSSAVTEPNVSSVAMPTQAPGDTPDQNSDGTMSTSAVQRRKRFSVKPKVTPTLTRTSNRTPRSPLKTVSESPVKAPCSDLTEKTAPCQVESTLSNALPSASQKSSEDSSLPSVPLHTATAAPTAGQMAQQSPETHTKMYCLPVSQTKVDAPKAPDKAPDKAPPSLPNKEAMAISERAKTLVSRSYKTPSRRSSASKRLSLSQLLNDQADLQRLAKANKLRELLKQEMHKEKAKCKKAKARVKEYTLDHTKMTMKDLIYYLPITNPMSVDVEESVQQNETVLPLSPRTEQQPENAKEPEIPPETTNQSHDDEVNEGAEEEDDVDEEEDDALMVPRVKVAEDGSLIIDEESLTVQVKRAKGTNPADNRDPIFERGSTTTYSSFRKGTHTKPWSTEETEMFFVAVSMVGTDFSMICQLFPHRARSEIKNKFKREERENAWRIDKAFKERRRLDLEYFTKLLEKILEVQSNKKLTRSGERKEKKKPKQQNRKSKENLPSEEDKVENVAPVVEEEDGGKENAEGTSAPPKKKHRKMKNGDLLSENAEKDISDKQGEACVHENAEPALQEENPSPMDGAEKPESVNPANETRIKPAQLSRGRAPKPLVPVGRRLAKKAPALTTKPKTDGGTTDATEKSLDEGPSDEKAVQEDSPSRQAKTRERVDTEGSSEDEDSTAKPSKPTRYGRTPKPVEHLNYPAKEDVHSPTSAAGPQEVKPRPLAKTKPKSPRLVTLRASQTESSDEGDGDLLEAEDMEEQATPSGPQEDSSAPVFVPASLRSPRPVVSAVEETMEELDIMSHVPDVLGVSQDVLSCEHQLDLLADVIDFLSADNMEVSEKESYTEAAQTLLTIGSLAHLSPSAQMNPPACEETAGSPPCDGNIALELVDSRGMPQKTFGPAVTPVSDIMERDTRANSHTSPQAVDAVGSAEVTVADLQSAGQIEAPSAPDTVAQCAPHARRGRLSKLKPKPNLGLAARMRTQGASLPVRVRTRTDGELCRPPSVAEGSSGGVLTPGAEGDVPVAGPHGEPGTVSTEHSDSQCLSQSSLTHTPHTHTDGTMATLIKPSEDSATTSKTLSVVLDPQGQGSPAIPSSPVQKFSEPATYWAAKSRSCKVKPKPNLGRSAGSRGQQSKPGPRDSRMEHMERPESPASKPNHTGHTVAQMEPQHTVTQMEPRHTGLKVAEMKPQHTDHKVAEMEPQHTGLKVAEMEPQHTDHKVAEMEPQHTGLKVAEMEPQHTDHKVAEMKPQHTDHKVAEMEPQHTDHKVAEMKQQNTDLKITEMEQQHTGLKVAEMKPQHTDHKVAEMEPQHTGLKVAEMEPQHTGLKVAEMEPQHTDHKVAEMEPQHTVVEMEPWHTGLKVAEMEPQGTAPDKPPADPCSSSVSEVPMEMAAPKTPMKESAPCSETRTGVGAGPHAGASSGSPPTNATPKRRGRLPKARPNIAACVRSKPAASADPISQRVLSCTDTPSEQQPKKVSHTHSDVKPVVGRSKTLLHSSKEEPCVSDNSGSLGPEATFENNSNIADVFTTSDTNVCKENSSVIVDSGASEMSCTGASPAIDSSASKQKAHTESAGFELSSSTRTTELNLCHTQDVSPISELKPPGKGSKPNPKTVLSDLVSCLLKEDPNTRGSAQQTSRSKHSKLSKESTLNSRDTPEEDLSEHVGANRTTTARPQDALNIDNQTQPSHSAPSSTKPRRTRLAKLKPNLGRRNRPANPLPAQSTADPEAASNNPLEAQEKQASPVLECKPICVILQPVGGASSPHVGVAKPVSGADPTCMTQMPVSFNQGDTSALGGSQCLPLHATNPNDSDEPYFILSLTEIPVFPQEGNSIEEPLPDPPTASAPVQMESLDTLMPQTTSVEGAVSSHDSAERHGACVQGMEKALTVSVKNTAMDPHEHAVVQQSGVAEVLGDCEEVDPPHKKKRVAVTRRGENGQALTNEGLHYGDASCQHQAKVQVKVSTAGRRQSGKTPTATEAELSSVAETRPPVPLPGQASVVTAERHVLTEPQGVAVEESTSTTGANSTAIRPGRKPKGFLSFLSDTSTATSLGTRATAQRPQVKPSRSGRKRAAPTPSTRKAPSGVACAADTVPEMPQLSAIVAPEQAASCLPLASASQCPAEVPVTLHGSLADEPMNVSQYFLSDIFTNVDEG